MLLSPKRILVTGAAGGIGSSVARHLIGLGYPVLLHYHQTKVDTTGLAAGTYWLFEADLTSEPDVQALAEYALQQLGGIDIVINCAAISDSGFSWKMTLPDWQRVISTNLTSVFLVTKHFLPFMRARGWGRIVTIGSEGGLTGLVGGSAYAASKAAMEGFCKSVAKEVADKNITVNNVSPGYIDAGMYYQLPEILRDTYPAQIPLRRLGNPMEVATLVAYLISGSASYITGQTLRVNGGLS